MFKSLLNIKSSFEQNLARKRYEEKLPQQLQALYGDARQYTPTQITIAIRKAGLPVKHRKVAYEMYLTPEEIQSFQERSYQHRDTSPLPSITLNKTMLG